MSRSRTGDVTRGAPETAPFRVSLIGAPRIETPAGELPSSKPVVFAAALYLLLQRGRRVRRAELAALLWPDADDAARGERLRWLVAQLKGHGIAVQARSPEIVIDAGEVAVDVEELLASAPGAGLDAQELGDLLAGYEPDVSDRFTLWLEEVRQDLGSRTRRWLLARMAAARRVGNWLVVEEIARRILRPDPENPDAGAALKEAVTMQSGPRRPSTSDRTSDALSARATPLVGRQDILGRLLDATDAANVSRRMAVAGPAGMGKSRLLQEFVSLATVRGTRVVVMRCTRADGLRPLSLVIDLAKELLELPGALGASPESLDVMRRFTGETTAVDELTSNDVRRAAVYAALNDLLSAVAEETPLAIVIDDAQWAERGSWPVLAPVLAKADGSRVASLVAIRASTPNDAEGVCAAIYPEDSAAVERELLWLVPLDIGSTRSLMRSRAAPREIPEKVLGMLVERAVGIPFVAEALVDQWLETGDPDSLPSSVGRLVQARVSRLSEESARVLTVVAILGQDAVLPAVEAAAAFDRSTLLRATNELALAGILRVSDGTFTSHALWTEAIQSRLSESAAQLIHAYAAEWLEQELARSGAADPRRSWAIAEHWLSAGQPARAEHALGEAARRLSGSGFSDEAADMMERAAEIAGDSQAALNYLRRAAEFARFLVGRTTERRIWNINARYDDMWRRLEPERFTPHHDIEAIALDGEPDPSNPEHQRRLHDCVLAESATLSHRVLAAYGLLKYHQKHFVVAQADAIWDVVSRLAPATDEESIAHALTGAVYFLKCRGDSSEAQRCIEPALRLVLGTHARSSFFFGSVMITASEVAECRGDLDGAQSLLRALLERGRSQQRPRYTANAVHTLLQTALEAGRISEARELLPMIGPIERLTGTTFHRSGMIALAVAALNDGDPARARMVFEVSLTDSDDIVAPMPRARVLAIYAHIALLEQDEVSIAELLPRLLACFSGRMTFMEHPAYVAAMCLERLGGMEAAEAFVRRYIDEIRSERWTPRPEILRYLTSSSSP